MKNNLVRFLTVSSLVAGSSFLVLAPANAVQISLEDKDSFDVTTYGALFTGEPFLSSGGEVITKVEFDDDNGFVQNFIPANLGAGSFAKADLTNAIDLEEIIATYTTNIGVAKVKSLDLLNPAHFVATTPPDTDFSDGGVQNNFDVLPAFGNFIEIDDPALSDAETPDLAVRLLTLSTTQSDPLTSTVANIGVGFTGDVEFLTFGPGGLEIVLGTGSFSTTFAGEGDNDADGTAVFSFEATSQVPESSSTGALLGLGLLGSAFAFKKKISAA